MSSDAYEQNVKQRQDIEDRFIHTDLNHPVIQTLFQLQLDKISEAEQE
jgi:hypothetical protein